MTPQPPPPNNYSSPQAKPIHRQNVPEQGLQKHCLRGHSGSPGRKKGAHRGAQTDWLSQLLSRQIHRGPWDLPGAGVLWAVSTRPAELFQVAVPIRKCWCLCASRWGGGLGRGPGCFSTRFGLQQLPRVSALKISLVLFQLQGQEEGQRVPPQPSAASWQAWLEGLDSFTERSYLWLPGAARSRGLGKECVAVKGATGHTQGGTSPEGGGPGAEV